MPLYEHVLFGLGVHSDLPLVDAAAACPRDVRVRRVTTAAPADDDAYVAARSDEPHREIRLGWPHVGLMAVRNGSEIVLLSPPDAETSVLRHIVNGVGLSLVLFQRGVMTVHASVVRIGGVAVAIAGPKGAGKSTLAAALLARGHTLLSDDVAALDFGPGGRPSVRAGTCSLNLWPDSMQALGLEPNAFGQIWSRSAKRVRTCAMDGMPAQTPLGLMVILAPNGGHDTPALRPLDPVDAFVGIVANSYAQRWLPDTDVSAAQLERYRDLITAVPVVRVQRGPSLDTLGQTVDRIEEACGAEDAGANGTTPAGGGILRLRPLAAAGFATSHTTSAERSPRIARPSRTISESR